MFRSRLLFVALLATLAVAVPATWAAAADESGKAGRLLVYHAWDSPSELAALKALVDRFQAANPGVAVSTPNVQRNPRSFFPILSKLVVAERAPEAFHGHDGYAVDPYVEAGLLSPIDEVWASEGLTKTVPAVIRNMSRIDGHYYGVPIGIHRVNLIWYNKALLDKYGIDASSLTTWDKLFKAADLLRSKGVASPMALGEGWTASTVAQAIIASMGIQFYEDWVNGKVTAPDDPTLLEAFNLFGRYLTYANADNANLPWDKALRRVIAGEAAFDVMGDWANGEFRLAGLKYGKDYAAMPVPGTKGMYGAAVDEFLHPRAVASPINSERWLRLVASRDGQDAFNVLKGSVPARSDADVTKYDAYQRSAIADLKSARYIFMAADEAVPDAFRSAVVDISAAFAADHDSRKAAGAVAQAADKLAKKFIHVWSLK
jgi:glucose/mannose transport system substrate-binding protein